MAGSAGSARSDGARAESGYEAGFPDPVHRGGAHGDGPRRAAESRGGAGYGGAGYGAADAGYSGNGRLDLDDVDMDLDLSRPDSDLGSEAEPGPSIGIGTGTGTGSGTGSGSGIGTGSGIGSGSGPGSGSSGDFGPGPGPGSDSFDGAKPQSDAAHPGNGRPDLDVDLSRPDTAPSTGPTTDPNTGPSTGPRSGRNRGNSPGTGSGTGSTPDSHNHGHGPGHAHSRAHLPEPLRHADFDQSDPDQSDLPFSQHAGVEPHGVDEPLVQPITEEDAPRTGRTLGGAGGIGPARSLAAGAALIAGVTVLSRLVGFLRTLVFSHTVGSNNLADAYNSANQIPNTVFDIVAGGALASVAVPLLAGPFARRDRAAASRIVSPLLTWSIAVLLPLSLIGMACAGLLGDLIAGPSHDIPGYAQTVSDFLTLFLPQIPLYAVAVVLSATLQADRRFLAPALAPLLSSLVVVCTYLLFGHTDPRAAGDLAALDGQARLILGLGTTLGVAMLVLALLPAVRRTGLRLRPTFRFPPGLARRAGALAVAGIATLVAQNLATLGVVLLTNYRAASGALAVYNFSWAVYVLPYAVLAVPIATTAFTDLSARAETGDHDGYRDAVASTTRAVLIAACAGAAMLVATAWPMAYLFIERDVPGGPTQSSMAYGLLAFAPGLLGYAAIAHLGRVLYAAGRGRAAAGATVVGWLTVLAADCALIFLLPKTEAVAALGLGNAIGMTVAGALLLLAVRRVIGRGVFAGLARAFAVSVLAAAAAGSVGWLAATVIGPVGPAAALAESAGCVLLALCLYAGALLVFDDGDLRPTLATITARLRARIRPGGAR